MWQENELGKLSVLQNITCGTLFRRCLAHHLELVKITNSTQTLDPPNAFNDSIYWPLLTTNSSNNHDLALVTCSYYQLWWISPSSLALTTISNDNWGDDHLRRPILTTISVNHLQQLTLTTYLVDYILKITKKM